MSLADTDTGRLRFVCIALFFGTLILFSRAMDCGFLDFDDPDFLTQNPQVQAGLHWQSAREAFLFSDAGNWSPLTRLSHVAAWQFFGNNPRGHHAINVFVHALNAVLAFLVLRQLTRSLWTSAASAALFAWHPLRVESVAWIAERKDVLSVFFGLLTFFTYAKYALQERNARQPRRRWYCFALACFAAGLLCKPMLVTVPFVLLLLDVWPLQRAALPARLDPASHSTGRYCAWSKLWLEKAPFLLLSCVSCFITYRIQRKDGGIAEEFSLGTRVANGVVSVMRYLGKFFWPEDLAVAYAHPAQWPVIVIIGSFALLLLITGIALWQFRRHPAILIGWFWFLGMLAPVIGVLQSGLQAMADRYTYLPIIGVQLALLGPLSSYLSANKNRMLAGGLLGPLALLFCAALTWHQIRYWTDSRTLFTHALAVSEKNYLAHAYLGTSCANSGELDGAIEHYQRAMALAPNYAAAHFGLGVAFEKKGLINDAMKQYQQAVQLKPNYPQAQYGFGLALLKQGFASEALSHFEVAASIDPNFASAQRGLGLAEARLGNASEAVRHFEKALSLDPQSSETQRDFARTLASINRHLEACVHFEQAIRLSPNQSALYYEMGLSLQALDREDKALSYYAESIRLDPTFAEAHYNLGVILLNRDQTADAVGQFQAAIRSHPEFGLAYFGFGVAAAQSGDFDQAIACYNQALTLLPNHAESHNALGHALAQTGRDREALVEWETAYKLDPTISGLVETITNARRQSSRNNP